jgi:hypothetical protein
MTDMQPAGWFPDPDDKKRWRYWDGSQWTEHRSEPKSEPQRPVVPQQAVAAQSTAAVPSDVVWEGASKAVGNSSKYRVTDLTVYFDKGRLSNRSEQVPINAIRDIDVRQSMVQKGRGIGDVVIHTIPGMANRESVTLESVENPHDVRDRLNAALVELRRRQHEHERGVSAAGAAQIHVGAAPAPAVATPTTSGASDMLANLKQLGELRDAGVLTEEEFQTQKAKLFGS